MFNGSLWIANILLQSTIDSKTTHENQQTDTMPDSKATWKIGSKQIDGQLDS